VVYGVVYGVGVRGWCTGVVYGGAWDAVAMHAGHLHRVGRHRLKALGGITVFKFWFNITEIMKLSLGLSLVHTKSSVIIVQSSNQTLGGSDSVESIYVTEFQ